MERRRAQEHIDLMLTINAAYVASKGDSAPFDARRAELLEKLK